MTHKPVRLGRQLPMWDLAQKAWPSRQVSVVDLMVPGPRVPLHTTSQVSSTRGHSRDCTITVILLRVYSLNSRRRHLPHAKKCCAMSSYRLRTPCRVYLFFLSHWVGPAPAPAPAPAASATPSTRHQEWKFRVWGFGFYVWSLGPPPDKS